MFSARLPNSNSGAFGARFGMTRGRPNSTSTIVDGWFGPTVARLPRPGGARSVIAESVLVKHPLLILNRSRTRSPNLRPADRVVAGLRAVFIRPAG